MAPWLEELLKAGGVVVTVVGLAGTVVTGGVTYLNNEQNVAAHKYEAAEKAETERTKADLGLRQAVCASTFEYLRDETPNTSLSEAQQKAVNDAIAHNVSQCSPTDTFFVPRPEAPQ